jgi:hypothetical protein
MFLSYLVPGFSSASLIKNVHGPCKYCPYVLYEIQLTVYDIHKVGTLTESFVFVDGP